jgi:hypothetical protein
MSKYNWLADVCIADRPKYPSERGNLYPAVEALRAQGRKVFRTGHIRLDAQGRRVKLHLVDGHLRTTSELIAMAGAL